MTVGALKAVLANVPDNTLVVATVHWNGEAPTGIVELELLGATVAPGSSPDSLLVILRCD